MQLADSSHEVTVITARYKNLPHVEEKGNISIIRIPALRKNPDRCSLVEMASFALSALLFSFRYFIFEKHRFNIVCIFFSIPTGTAALAAWITRQPYVVYLRGSDVPRKEIENMKWLYFFCKPFLRILWKNASSVIAVSQGLADEARKTFVDLKCTVIPNGINLSKFKPIIIRPQSQESQKEIHFMTAGRIRKFKGLQYLIASLPETIRILDSQGIRILIDMYGDGDFLWDLIRLSKTNRSFERICMHGWNDQEKLFDFYSKADVFVQPSLVEGMPNTILEAMAAGLPIIATDVAGSRDLVKDEVNGIVVEPGNSKALSEALIKIASNSQLRYSMSLSSLERIRDFQWPVLAKRHFDIYQQIVSQSG
jgi:Glycosyltransferase